MNYEKTHKKIEKIETTTNAEEYTIHLKDERVHLIVNNAAINVDSNINKVITIESPFVPMEAVPEFSSEEEVGMYSVQFSIDFQKIPLKFLSNISSQIVYMHPPLKPDGSFLQMFNNQRFFNLISIENEEDEFYKQVGRVTLYINLTLVATPTAIERSPVEAKCIVKLFPFEKFY